MAKQKRRSRADVRKVRNEILKITKKSPKSVKQIMKETDDNKIQEDLKESSKHSWKISKFSQIHLTDLKEKGLIYMYESADLKNVEVEDKRNSYYINTENSGAEGFKKIFEVFLIKLGGFIEDKKDIRKKVIEICKLLSKFEALNDFSKKIGWKTHKHLKDGNLKIKRLTHKEDIKFLNQLKLFLTEKSKHKKLSPDEKRILEGFKKEDLNLDTLIEDEQWTKIQNKIYKRFEKIDGSLEMYGLAGEITRKINDLIKSLYRDINLTTILNKITNDLEKKKS